MNEPQVCLSLLLLLTMGPWRSLAAQTMTDDCTLCGANAICQEFAGNIRKCVCREGFNGDGFTCRDVDECASSQLHSCSDLGMGFCENTIGSYICHCYDGFQLSAGECVDIDECRSHDQNRCDEHAICSNQNGGYSCLCEDGYYGDGYHCSLKQCTETLCAFGSECLEAFSSHICVDPCNNYTELTDYWRSTSVGLQSRNCDHYLQGWYRLRGRGGVRMPETCVPEFSCNTYAPVWLNGAHPSVEEGIVNKTVCATWYSWWGSQCCKYFSTVQIKQCPDGFYVYKLNGTPNGFCNLAYCTDPSYPDTECFDCTSEEECKEVNGVRGCHCKNEFSSIELSSLQPDVVCGSTYMKISFSTCQLKHLGLNISSMHLRDSSCVPYEERNGTGVMSGKTDIQSGACGTTFSTNGTHATYMNNMYITPIGGSVIVRDPDIQLNFSCTYVLDMAISLDVTLQPLLSSLTISVEDTESFSLKMATYSDPYYSSPYTGTEITLSHKTVIYVGGMITGRETSRYKLLIKNCYATPSNNPDDLQKFYIIQNR